MSALACFPGCERNETETERTADQGVGRYGKDRRASGTTPMGNADAPSINRSDRLHAPGEPPLWFVDVTAEVGLDFVHACGRKGEHHLPEIMGGGAAVFDYDGDGRLDLYLINSGDHLPGTGHPITVTNRLFRQEPDGRFVDVTESSGLGDAGYGMGCAVGDIDNDGDLDVYVTNWGPDVLYRNNGDGTFTQVSAESGIENNRWSVSAAFLDYDRDGLLDLFVTNYLAYDRNFSCLDRVGRRQYCAPNRFPRVADVLYHNEGDGRFVDVTAAAGIAATQYAGMGVVCADFDDDGWMDVYVANDGDANNLWINQRDGTFVDSALILGAAYNFNGVAEAGMGVTSGDVDADGDLDLFVTHLIKETNTQYRNLGSLGFEDHTAAAALGLSGLDLTGFGTALADYDNDGDLDLAVVNGAVKLRQTPLGGRENWFWNAFVEPNLLWTNDGDGTFHDVSASAGTFATELEVSRGLIPADLDNDGDLDLLVTSIEGRARVYRNESFRGTHWIKVQALLPGRRREALGAKVTVVTKERRTVRHAIPPGGYLSGGEGTIHVGLGSADRVERFEVRWPDGTREVFPGCDADQLVQLRKGGAGTR